MIRANRANEPGIAAAGSNKVPGKQHYLDDLSHLDKETGARRLEIDKHEAMIDSVLSKELRNHTMSYRPRYNPDLDPQFTAISKEGAGIQIGPAGFRTRYELSKTMLHEDRHHFLWSIGIRGIKGDHHPLGSKMARDFYLHVDLKLQSLGIRK